MAGGALPLAGLRVLVVEDVLVIAREVAAIVAEAGGEIVGPVPSLVRALRLLERERIDAAVLDVELADGGSAPVAEALAGRGIPMVYATGYEGTSAIDALPPAPVLGKPFAPEDLTAALIAAVGRRPRHASEGAGRCTCGRCPDNEGLTPGATVPA